MKRRGRKPIKNDISDDATKEVMLSMDLPEESLETIRLIGLERVSWVIKVRCNKKAKTDVIVEGQRILQDTLDRLGKIKGTRGVEFVLTEGS
jgi:hypothetical protein